MPQQYSFEAKVRTQKGKAHAGSLRRNGRVPGVVYGQGKESQAVELEDKEMNALIAKTMGLNALLTMKLADEKGGTSERTVMFKEVQREPVKSKLWHVDFYLVDPASKLKLKVPVRLEGVAAGTKEGGILEHGVRSLNVRCLPSAIPSAIKVDVSNLGLDQSILLEQLPRSEGVDFLDDPHAVLAHVAAVEEEAPAAAAAGTTDQPEVIGEKEKEAKRAEKEGAKAPAADAKDAKAAPAKK